jgi:hypothetical protein
MIVLMIDYNTDTAKKIHHQHSEQGVMLITRIAFILVTKSALVVNSALVN